MHIVKCSLDNFRDFRMQRKRPHYEQCLSNVGVPEHTRVSAHLTQRHHIWGDDPQVLCNDGHLPQLLRSG